MEEPIYIVSGLPRSGTSVMMQMLEAGGIPVVTDNIRTADIDNPKGYYEFEKVKQIREDSSWLPETRGRVFKMVSMLLFDLPPDYQYRVVFTRRKMDEIIRSENKMLERLGKPSNVPDGEMGNLLEKHLEKVLEWMEDQAYIDYHQVWFHELIEKPKKLVKPLQRFLGRKMDLKSMIAVVDPELYRNRAK